MIITFSSFAWKCIDELKLCGCFPTANLYHYSVCSFSEFLHCEEIRFGDIKPKVLKAYERHLLSTGHRYNTISTYMRMLRAIYNKAVTAGITKFVFRQFHDVFTGIDRSHSKPLNEYAVNKILNGRVDSPVLKKVQQTARVMYKLCGIPFVDLQHITFDSIKDGVLKYSRQKTGAGVNIPVMKEVRQLLGVIDIRNYDLSTAEGYRNYQSLLRKFNAGLKRLADKLGVKSHVSSYTFRHSWATNALRNHVSIEVISSALGHADIRTTQLYLSGFAAEEIGRANRKVCRSLESA
jgi:site-specific recombinase XerC